MIYTLMISTIKISETSEQKMTQKWQRKTDVLIPKAECLDRYYELYFKCLTESIFKTEKLTLFQMLTDKQNLT